MGASLFNFSDLIYEDNYFPSNQIFLTFDINKSARFEPAFGITITEFVKWYSVDLGIMGKKKKENFNLLYGIRVGVNMQVFSKYSNSETYMHAALIIGGEYLLGNHFSLGTEIQLRGGDNNNNGIVYTNSMFISRFYF